MIDQLLDNSISVIVPIYNEIELCEQSLRTIHGFLREHFKTFEIVVVESGSNDGSAALCDELARDWPTLKVLHETERNGMGAALRLGYGAAKYDAVLLVTADMAFPLETILEAIPLMRDVDCVLSYRKADNRSAMRLLQSWVYSRIVRSALSLPMRSVNSAFKLMRRDFVQSLPLISRGWFLDAEILYWIVQRRVSYVEIPVELIERTAGQSKVTLLDWIKTLRELVAFRAALQRIAKSDK